MTDFRTRGQFPHTITVEDEGTHGFMGDETQQNSRTVDAYIKRETKMVRSSAQGAGSSVESVVSDLQVSVPGDVSIGLEAKITLPDGSSPQIISKEEVHDHRGNLVKQRYFCGS